jgi:hypothetical protein
VRRLALVQRKQTGPSSVMYVAVFFYFSFFRCMLMAYGIGKIAGKASFLVSYAGSK